MHVADLIMKEGICGELRNKTRVIVTNAIQHLKYADVVYVVENGEISFKGSYKELQGNDVYQELKKTTLVRTIYIINYF